MTLEDCDMPRHSLIVLIVWTAALCVGAATAPVPTPLPIGAAAPDFALPGVDGKTSRLADFAEAKVLVLVFTCNHCPTAQAYEDRIQAIARDYREKGVALVAISPNDPLAVRLDELGYSDMNDGFEEMQQRALDQDFQFPYLYDGDNQAVSRAYGPIATPHVFVFDAARKLRYAGRIDDSEKVDKVTSHDTRNAIDALLEGRDVPVETTKTFGCSVKWSDKRHTVQEAFERWAKEAVELEKLDTEGVKRLVQNDSDKLRLINVWATWCGPCTIEFPELITMHRMYRNRDFELITISMDEQERAGKVHEFLRKQQASTRNYLYDGANAYELIEAVDSNWHGALPYTLLVAPGGEVLLRSMGPFEPMEVKKAIVEHLGRTY
jgi:peroxiredoxin